MLKYQKPSFDQLIKVVFTCLCIGLAISCSEGHLIEEHCLDGTIDHIEINNLRYFQNIDERDTVVNLVIRSQDDYEQYFQERLVPVDFTKNTILAGRFIATSGDYVDNQKVMIDCNSKEIIYNVKLSRGTAAATTRVPYVVLVPKLSDHFIVRFNVSY